MADYYQVLALDPGASFTAINDAREKLKRIHAGDSAMLQRLEEAWSVLANPVTRKEYDRALAQSAAAPGAAQPSAGSPRPPAGQGSKRPATQLIDAGPSPHAAKQSRPKTEIIDVRQPPSTSGGARLKTEIIDNNPPPPPRAARSSTEMIDYNPTARHDGAARSSTEIIDYGGQSIDDARKPARPPETAIGSIVIIVTANNAQVAEYTLGSGTHVIGRATSSGEEPSIRLNDRFVSRKHAILEITPDSASIRDDGSLNGTRLNGERIQSGTPYRLKDRAVIQIEHFFLIVNFGGDSQT